MRNRTLTRIFISLCLVSTFVSGSVLIRSGSRSKHILMSALLHPRSRSSILGTSLFHYPLQTFNRPHGTVAIQPTDHAGSFENTYGRTFGQYGSYRNHQSWQEAVKEDNKRHSVIGNNLKETFPWLFKNLKTPSLQGFGLDGFWNSYTPYIPEGSQSEVG